MDISEILRSHGDEKYKSFQGALVPTVAQDEIIGVRIPILRKLAAKLCNTDKWREFIVSLPHKYFDENNLHALIICRIKDYDECVAMIDMFLPFVNNWETCDSLSPTVLSNHKSKLLNDIQRWMSSRHPFTVRFGIEMLMKHFLDKSFNPQYLDLVSSVSSDEYYVKMMVAWYFATALTKQYPSTIKYIEEHRLDNWIHRKVIQKATESLCLTKEQKEYLKTLK